MDCDCSGCACDAVPTLEPTRSFVCPDDFELFDGKCWYYAVHIDGSEVAETTRDGCDLMCQHMDATLLCIQNEEQYEYVWGRMETGTWVGLNDRNVEGDFRWPTGCDSTFVHWAIGRIQPLRSAAVEHAHPSWHR